MKFATMISKRLWDNLKLLVDGVDDKASQSQWDLRSAHSFQANSCTPRRVVLCYSGLALDPLFLITLFVKRRLDRLPPRCCPGIPSVKARQLAEPGLNASQLAFGCSARASLSTVCRSAVTGMVGIVGYGEH
jgi:hypothetical protein